MVVRALCIVVGWLLILGALNDIFQSVLVPRAVGRRFRISFLVWRILWNLWPKLGWFLHPRKHEAREDFLAIFAPFALVVLMVTWASFELTGYALIYWAHRESFGPPLHSFSDSLYFSGVSLSTLGFGDIVGRAKGPRFYSIAEAATGLATLSIVTTYLFALFGSFQSRETFVVTTGARAGTPPSGVNLLCIAAYSDTIDDLHDLMVDAQRWSAMVMESHLAYPVLAYFRSSHDDESWIGTLGSLLDAAALLMTTVDGVRSGQARIFYNVARHATRDISHYFEAGTDSPGIERHEFEHACDRLAASGYTLKERGEAWERFAALRSSYASNLNAIARFFHIPPVQWIGDRSTIKRAKH